MKKILLATSLILGSSLAISLKEYEHSRLSIHEDGDDFSNNNGRTPEESVAKVVIEKSEEFKRKARVAAKASEVSKKVSNRAMDNAHAF